MKVFSISDTNENRRLNRGSAKYPDAADPRCVDSIIFPRISPKFQITPGARVFTVGSCFARNIERLLGSFEVPTREYEPPLGDPLCGRKNTVLNEYNAGTISQRLSQSHSSDDPRGIHKEESGYTDYLITGSEPASLDVVVARRKRIASVYDKLVGTDLLIITLGMTECWYDCEDQLFLNRAPLADAFRKPDTYSRFEFRVLGEKECYELLATALQRLQTADTVKNVIVTVSPVPLQRTFSPDDALLANCKSKSTLRNVADALAEDFKHVDYFPSYEMVTSYIGNPFESDNVHVRSDIVASITEYMMETYT